MSVGEMKSTRYHDVDRGWAWLMMAGNYLGFFISCCTLYNIGVFYVALLEKFDEGEGKTSLVGATCSGVLCILSPLASGFINYFGCRQGIVVGGAILTASNIISGFVASLDALILSAGIMAGIGYSLSGAGLIVCLGYYFERWRDRVISLLFFMVGLGLFTSSPLGLWMLETYGLRGAFIATGWLNAQLCVIGMICRPSSIEKELLSKQRDKKTTLCQDISSSINVRLLKKMPLDLFLFSTVTWNFAFLVAVMHLPNYMTVNGLSDSEIVLLMTALSIANTAGRFGGVLVASRAWIDNLHVNTGVLAVGGVLSLLSPLYTSTTAGKFVFTIQLGVFIGVPNVLMTIICIRLTGGSTISEAHGFSYFACGVGGILGPVITGFVLGSTGKYTDSFLLVGSVLLVGSLLSFFAWLSHVKTKPPQETVHPTEMDILMTAGSNKEQNL